MRGIRIWHLAAAALTVPLLVAATPSGCTGVLNPNFIEAMGGNAASAGVAAPNGFIVLGLFNYTGWPGHVDFSTPSDTVGSETGWLWGLPADQPTYIAWACGVYVSEIDLSGGEIFEVDSTGAVQPKAINYDGGALGLDQLGNPLECGTLIKANIRYGVNDDVRIDVELIK